MKSNLFGNQSQLKHKRINTAQLNLFQIAEHKVPVKLNPRLSMIQKLKNQTLELKQIKKTISALSGSRLNSMKRINLNNVNDQQQSQYRFNSKIDTQSDRYGFTKSLREAVRFRQQNQRGQRDVESDRNNQLIQKDENLKSEGSNNCHTGTEQKTEQINLISSQHHHQTQQSNELQKPALVTRNDSMPKVLRHLRKMDSQDDKHGDFISTQKGSFGARSQRRLRSSVSSFSRPQRNNEMTLSVRRRLHEMQSKQRLVQNKIRLIESQTEHKLEKKIKENAQLVQKHKGLYEIIHKRMQREREKSIFVRKKIQQRRFIQEGKRMKVNMERFSKKMYHQKEQEIIRSQSEESLLNLAYKSYAKQKEDLAKQENLAFRVSFVRDFESKDLVGSRISLTKSRSISRVASADRQF